MKLVGRRVLVVGLGRSGVAACALLLDRGASVRAIDRDTTARERPAVVELVERGLIVEAGPHSRGQLADAELVVVSPGVASDSAPLRAARERGVAVIGELELAARTARARLAAITGSNGKSTTTCLAAEMLRASGVAAREGGNLGPPACELVRAPSGGDGTPGPEREVLVLEVSSFQAETLRDARFEAVAILNVSADHLDRHASFEAYAEAKLSLLERQDEGGSAVLAASDPVVAAAASRARGTVTWFGADAADEARPVVRVGGGQACHVRPGEAPRRLFDPCSLWSPAPHDLENALAAAALALGLGATPAGIAEAVGSFRGLPHRMAQVVTDASVRFFDDSKATNVAAAVAAIRGAGPGVVAILGGRHKGGDLSPLRSALEDVAGRAVLIGEAADEIATALGTAVEHVRAADLRDAVRRGADLAGAGGTVLLAPACSSFDMFADFEDRGRQFAAAVHERFGRPAPAGARQPGDGSRPGRVPRGGAGCAA